MPLLRSLALAVLFALALPAREATARSTEAAPLAGWMVDRWTVEDGLPLDHLTGIAQTADRTLWLATYDGLVRFDGLVFEVYRRTSLPGLPTNRFQAIATDADDAVWALSEVGHLVRLRGGEVRVWSPGVELPAAVTSLQRDGETLYAHSRVGPLRITPDGPELAFPDAERAPSTVARAVGDTTWIGTEAGHLLRAGPLRTRPVADVGGRIHDLWVQRDTVWIASEAGVFRLDAGEVGAARDPARTGPACAFHATGDAPLVLTGAGWLEVGTWTARGAPPTRLDCDALPPPSPAPPWRLDPHAVHHDGQLVLQPDGAVNAALVDRDGHLWVGVIQRGLVRVRPAALSTWLGPPDHPLGATRAVFVDSSARTWVGGAGRLLRVDRGATTVIDHRAGAPERWPHDLVKSVAEDARGDVWVGTGGHLCRVDGEACRPAGLPTRGEACPPSGVLLATRDGTLWAGSDCAVHRGRPELDPADWAAVPIPGRDRIRVRALAEAPDGSVLVGTFGDGLLRLVEDRVEALTTAQGLSSDLVRAIRVDAQGVAWIGTVDGGLCVARLVDAAGSLLPLDAVSPACVDRRHGLFDDIVHATLQDAQGRVWLSTNRGVGWVRRAAVEAFAAGEADHVQSVVYDTDDGLLDREANGGTSPAAAIDGRGRMLFATQRGVAVVDPSSVPIPPAPPLAIDRVTVDGAPLDLAGRPARVDLSAGPHELAVSWHAVDLQRPEQVRYRYRLLGLDRDWLGPTAARGAHWGHLPPGEFELQVEAGLGGAWSTTPATLLVSRPPALEEAAWFPAAIAGAGMLVLVALALSALLSHERRQRELEALVTARTAELESSNQALERQAAAMREQNVQLAEQASVLADRNARIAAQAARLAEVDELKMRFVANLSHELRTPLALVAGPLDDLASDVTLLGDQAKARLTVAQQNLRRLNHLVEQLFAVRGLDTGELPLRATRRELGGFVQTVASRFALDAERNRVSLRTRVPHDPVPAWFDADLIDKAVSNLVMNALKFTPAGGHVEVALTVSELDDTARVAVSDTGAGVPEEARDRVFDRFYQADGGDTRRHGGAGIGLALVREIALLHGGEVTLDSVTGAGSTFTLTLPLGADHIDPEDVDVSSETTGADLSVSLERSAPPPEGGGAAPLVLVVEDHPEMRAYLAEHLAHSFRVVTAEDGQDGLDTARRVRPDLIVSDVMMPRMDGLTLARRLEEDPSLDAIPLVLVTAKGTRDDREEGLRVADAYITKPFIMRDLIAGITALLEGDTPEQEPAPTPEVPEVDRAFVARLERAVTANLADTELNVSTLARQLAMSRRQLQREVRRLTGMSPNDYLRSLRLTHARDLLVRGRYATIGEVATAVGMSRGYFTRLYTSWFGHPPSDDLRR